MQIKPGLSLRIVALGIFSVFFFTLLVAQKTKSESPRAQKNQEIQHAAVVINIEVPVRVYKGGRFVNDLSIKDFLLYEDGVLQRIDAVYLNKKKTVEREEKHKQAVKATKPEIELRNFVFVFEIRHYLPKLNEVLDYFFSQVMLDGDSLMVFTPVNFYSIKNNAIKILPRQKIADQLKGKLRKDIVLGAAEYRTCFDMIRRIMNSEGYSVGTKRLMCMDILRKMKEMKRFDEAKLVQLSENLKQTEGEKHVFLFFQNESLPIPDVISPFDKLEILKDVYFDTKKIKIAFSDLSISCHFIFITKQPAYELDITRFSSQGESRISMEESSAEIFGAFNELAKATGGLTESSANVAKAFQKTVEASENYYLVYYTPKDYKADNQFHKIDIRIRGGGYRITHRAGYMAD